jgi:hypothetical protein
VLWGDDMAKHPGNETLIQRLLEGKTYQEMADEFQCGIATIHAWLHAEEIAEESARARESSAEAWLDRGLAVIASSLQKTGDIDPSAARAYAQECARRAAIRNPRYRDNSKVEVTGKDGGPVQSSVTLEIIGVAPVPRETSG